MSSAFTVLGSAPPPPPRPATLRPRNLSLLPSRNSVPRKPALPPPGTHRSAFRLCGTVKCGPRVPSAPKHFHGSFVRQMRLRGSLRFSDKVKYFSSCTVETKAQDLKQENHLFPGEIRCDPLGEHESFVLLLLPPLVFLRSSVSCVNPVASFKNLTCGRTPDTYPVYTPDGPFGLPCGCLPAGGGGGRGHGPAGLPLFATRE